MCRVNNFECKKAAVVDTGDGEKQGGFVPRLRLLPAEGEIGMGWGKVRVMKCVVSVLCALVLMLTALMSPKAGAAETYALEDLYRIALIQAERIRISEENLAVSRLGREKALSYLLPRASAFGAFTRYSDDKRNAAGSLIQPETAGSWGVRLDETLSLSGRELTALSMSKDLIVQSRFELDAVKEEYLLNVAAAYYEVLKSGKNLDIADANLNRLLKYRDAAEKRLKVGEITKTVLLRAEGELSGARSDRLKAANLHDLAKKVLARVAGISGDYSLRESPVETSELPPLSVEQDTANRERPDLKGLEIQRKLAEDQVRVTRGAYWPSLSLSAVYSGADQDPASSNLNRESIYGTLSLNFPFFEGGLRQAEVKEALARERQAHHRYEDLKKTIGVEVQSAYLEVVTQKGQIRFLDDQLAFAKDNYFAVSRQFEFGLSSSIDVIDANTLLVSAERKLAEALYSYQVARLKLKKATGMLLKTAVGTQGRTGEATGG